MVDRLQRWLKTLDLSLPSQRRSRSASEIIDRRTRPEDVNSTRFTPPADQPHHEVSLSHPSREGSPETPVEDTTGTITTHSHVDRKFGSTVPTVGKAAAPQEIFTSGDFKAAPENTSHSTATNEARAEGTTNVLVIEGPKKPEVAAGLLYALTWAEHDLELKEPLSTGGHMGYRTHGVFPRREHSCTAIPKSEGEFIVFGGIVPHGGRDVWTNDVFLLSTMDMSLTSLETKGEKPAGKTAHGAVILGRVLVVFGGSGDDSHLHFLNLDTLEWSKLRPPAPYPGPRYGHSFILVDDTIWLFGGRRWPEGAMDDMWCIKFGSDAIEYVQWRQIPKKEPWPGALSYHSTVYYDGSLYLFAGERKDHKGAWTVQNDVWKFEIRAETWTKIPCHGLLPEPRSGPSATVIGGVMITIGGGSDLTRKEPTDHAYAFNFQDQTWRGLALFGRSPPRNEGGVLLAIGSRLVAMGGHTDSKLCIHVAEMRAAGSAQDSFAKLQFTTETNQLKFTTEVVDLSRFVRKRGDAAHAMAGFSDVWKGEMTETGKPIAIKVLRVASTGNPDDPHSGRLRTRFDRELTIWMECQHPRVLELLGYAYIEGVPCLISPWCANGNIMEYFAKNPNADRRRLINQVAEGLVYLHGREPPVVHSDIKPANVIVSDEGNAKICDFGISKLMQENPSGYTTTASVKGTLRYSSPEMLDLDGMSTTSSDVWAFGMLILHVMTSKLPYAGALSDPKVIMAIMSGKKPLPEDYPELPATDPLWDVMRECWNDDPAKRPGMADVFDKLRKCTGTQET